MLRELLNCCAQQTQIEKAPHVRFIPTALRTFLKTPHSTMWGAVLTLLDRRQTSQPRCGELNGDFHALTSLAVSPTKITAPCP